MKKSYIRRKPHKIKRKKSILKNRFFWLAILSLAVSVAAFYFFIFSSFFQVKEIKIEVINQQRISREALESLIWEQVESKALFLPTKSVILVNLKKLNEDLSKRFPQINKINLKRDFPARLNIIVFERMPIGIWCQSFNESDDGEAFDCFFIDKEGVIFEKAVLAPGLTIKNFGSKLEFSLGDKILETEDLNLILKIRETLQKKNIDNEEFAIISQTQLNAKTLEGWWVYLNPENDIDWQMVQLDLVLEKQIPPDKREKLEYIDLRFDKIFTFPDFNQL